MFNTSSGRARQNTAISHCALSATQCAGVVGLLLVSRQARCSRHYALNSLRQILTLAALSPVSVSFGGLLSAMCFAFAVSHEQIYV